MIVTAYKAQSIGDGKIANLDIIVAESFPTTGTLAESQAVMLDDAQRIVTALHNTLPQGTWSQLVAAVAAQWAADQHGIITASAWYPGVSQHKETQP